MNDESSKSHNAILWSPPDNTVYSFFKIQTKLTRDACSPKVLLFDGLVKSHNLTLLRVSPDITILSLLEMQTD